ncbi:hypothetical protein LOTGIDRAFT_155039 [Lottia gigantea]|uniref:PWWP domain-containing protein n=1 Tax=Lottia gigantea TaxID=225164 RepID=V3Z4F2_LOTGI|nr:hypothetical protein LOTGIDRAFT_155039 [Lottia gigantea]ESO85553.1 hypothetical protein LOTGIDRAFT_155039 [Lottia gigantea]
MDKSDICWAKPPDTTVWWPVRVMEKTGSKYDVFVKCDYSMLHAHKVIPFLAGTLERKKKKSTLQAFLGDYEWAIKALDGASDSANEEAPDSDIDVAPDVIPESRDIDVATEVVISQSRDINVAKEVVISNSRDIDVALESRDIDVTTESDKCVAMAYDDDDGTCKLVEKTLVALQASEQSVCEQKCSSGSEDDNCDPGSSKDLDYDPNESSCYDSDALSDCSDPDDNHIDHGMGSALDTALPDIEDEEELKSPSNAIKLKYDLIRVAETKSLLAGIESNKDRSNRKWKHYKEEATEFIDAVRQNGQKR